MLKQIVTAMLALPVLWIGTANADSTVSYATSTGGYAEATSIGHGNARVRSQATSRQGGTAIAKARGLAQSGGFADASANAKAIGGFAKSLAHAEVSGWDEDWSSQVSRAVAHSNAISHRTRAVANSTSIKRPPVVVQPVVVKPVVVRPVIIRPVVVQRAVCYRPCVYTVYRRCR